MNNFISLKKKISLTRLFSNSLGFSLIENIVAIIVLGVLASVAIPKYHTVIEKGKAMEALPILESIRAAQIAYKAEHGDYASGAGAIDLLDVSFYASRFFPSNPSAHFYRPAAINTATSTEGCGVSLSPNAIGSIWAGANSNTELRYTIFILEDGSFECVPTNCVSDICGKIGY